MPDTFFLIFVLEMMLETEILPFCLRKYNLLYNVNLIFFKVNTKKSPIAEIEFYLSRAGRRCFFYMSKKRHIEI